MGTDIHPYYEKKNEVNGEWEGIDLGESFDLSRNYLLFAVLAGVRNGLGFAGVQTHTPLTPIDEPRGIPEDTSYENVYDDDIFCDLGDHSYSSVMFSEIIDYLDKPQQITRYGIVTKEVYNQLETNAVPETWCGGISGPDVVVYDNTQPTNGRVDIPDEYTHVRVSWEVLVKDELRGYYDLFKSALDEFGDIRMVFGFDS